MMLNNDDLDDDNCDYLHELSLYLLFSFELS